DSPAMSTIMASRALLTARPSSGRARGTTRRGMTRLPVSMLGELVECHDAQHDGQIDERGEEETARIGDRLPPPEPDRAPQEGEPEPEGHQEVGDARETHERRQEPDGEQGEAVRDHL